ncbi:MAG: hypothetical protein GAK38_00541 [Xylophilus sp.]|nr:MAG: hypothetical protein GAK38_00541 [Xylophilus sp.]
MGLSWYTWLEQGRAIGVSAAFLDSLARVLRLDAAERRHLYLLAHERPPAEPGRTWCQVPAPVLRLMHELPHAAYVINLRWDVLAFNDAADRLFGFAAHAPARRNLLWLLFTSPLLRERFAGWETQAPAMLPGFRIDFGRAQQAPDMQELVDELEKVSPEFRAAWRRHEVRDGCQGMRTLVVDGEAAAFDHTSLTIDADRHLRLAVYARQPVGTFSPPPPDPRRAPRSRPRASPTRSRAACPRAGCATSRPASSTRRPRAPWPRRTRTATRPRA